MSGGQKSREDFLTRWSRRKREIGASERVAETPLAEQEKQAATPSQQVVPEFNPATLPPIESINALSDIRDFLRAGVPPELTRAALRRVWSADPAIRDFVGLAENAWDFTDPAAMPGFGPLDATDDVRKMVAQIMSEMGDTGEVPNAGLHNSPTQAPENMGNSTAVTAGDGDVAEPDQLSDRSPGTKGEAPLGPEDTAVAVQQDNPIRNDKKPLKRHAHGGALPH